MKLSLLLKLQLSYMFFGMLYNCISMALILQLNKGLSPTSPYSGLTVMAIYGLLLFSGYKGKIRLYRIFMGISIFALGYGGIVKHIINISQMELYYSWTTWIAAIVINFFGLVLNTIALSGRFKD